MHLLTVVVFATFLQVHIFVQFETISKGRERVSYQNQHVQTKSEKETLFLHISEVNHVAQMK